jgi:putative DNA primase/helicase
MIQVPLKERARGRWKSILPMLGLADTKTLSGRHGPCPFCGGKDRFRFDDREGVGSFICSHCGAGDGVEFVIRKTGLDFRGAAQKIETVIGTAPRIEASARKDHEQQRLMLRELWVSSAPVRVGDPVSRFHRARRIELDIYPACLRYHDALLHRDDATGLKTRHPGMLALVHGPDGTAATLHRTYLTADGSKAPVDGVRKLMPGSLPRGSAVRLAPAGEVLGIAEGIETALAASALFGVPVWAALTAGNMETWRPPEGVSRVVVYGDRDANHRGQAAAYHLANKIQSAEIAVSVEFPNIGSDWNDELIGKGIGYKDSPGGR